MSDDHCTVLLPAAPAGGLGGIVQPVGGMRYGMSLFSVAGGFEDCPQRYWSSVFWRLVV